MEPEPGVQYPLVLGPSLLGKRKAYDYCSLRYDFLPASAARADQGHASILADSQVLLRLSGAGGAEQVFAGREEVSREGLDCVAIFDGTQFRLEVLQSSFKGLKYRPAASRNGAPAGQAQPPSLPSTVTLEAAAVAVEGAEEEELDADQGFPGFASHPAAERGPQGAAAAAAGAGAAGAARAEGGEEELGDEDLEQALFEHLSYEDEEEGQQQGRAAAAAVAAPAGEAVQGAAAEPALPPQQQQQQQRPQQPAAAEPAPPLPQPEQRGGPSPAIAAAPPVAAATAAAPAAAPRPKKPRPAREPKPAAAPAAAAAAPPAALSEFDLEFFGDQVGSPEPPGESEPGSSSSDEEGGSSSDDEGDSSGDEGGADDAEEELI